ncbi:MAG TPA: SRPBCC family protein [Acidimicrobiales bacterium]|nr:SRPBCC family protein [Acidimicrobiales bacterium]
MSKRQVIEVSARSSRPAIEVYERLADASTWAAWSPMSEVVVESGSGVGEVRRLTRGRTVGRDETTELVPGKRFAYRSLGGLPVRDYTATVDLTPTDDGGTTVTWRSSFEPKIPLTGAVMRKGIEGFLQQCADGVAA